MNPRPVNRIDKAARPGKSRVGLAGWAGLAGMLSVNLGCAWHGSGGDTYIGPAFVRRCGPEGKLVQTIQAPFLFEGGRQAGLTFGVAKRETLSPLINASNTTARAADPRWHFSLLTTVVPFPQPHCFVSRRFAGVQLQFGEEARALSLGWGSSIRVLPPGNAILAVQYDSGNPAESRMTLKQSLP